MKCRVGLPACVLLLWTLTASVSCNGDPKPEIKVKTVSDGIELSCTDKNYDIKSKNGTDEKTLNLGYKDENSGAYTFKSSVDPDGVTIYVKFRTCDNCIELDLTSIMGIVAGDVVATIVIGVAVYLVASLTRSGPITSNKKSSDRQHLVPNEQQSNRATNDNYQPLRYKGGQKETYDVLASRR